MQTIAFYSYKGGVGRTLVLANIAQLLARFGQNVFALDLDLEAPGLHYKFGLKRDDQDVCRGVVGYIHSCMVDLKVPESLDSYVHEIGIPENFTGKIHLMPAGNAPDYRYVRQLGEIDWHRLFYPDQQNVGTLERDSTDKLPIGIPLFLKLKKQIQDQFNPDFLLIDSRTGITEIGGVAVNILADKVVAMLLNNRENKDGIREVLRSIKRQNVQMQPGVEDILVLSRIPEIDHDTDTNVAKELIEYLNQPSSIDPEATLDISDLCVLHSERGLEITEALRIGGRISPVASILLRDYLQLAQRMFPTNVLPDDARRFLIQISKNATDDRVSTRTEAQAICKRIESRRNSGKAWLVVMDGKYILGRHYKFFVDTVVRRLVEDRDVEELQKDEAARITTLDISKIRWDQITLQMRHGVFDFCRDPYFATESRRHLLGFFQFGWVHTFTAYVHEDSEIYKNLCTKVHSEPLEMEVGLQCLLNLGIEDTNIGTLGETAAAGECESTLAKIEPGKVPHSEPSADQLYDWLKDKKGQLKNKVIICDHGVALYLDEKFHRDPKVEPDNKRFKSNTPGLVFKFRSPLPVGFAYPLDDDEWGQTIATAIAKFIASEEWEQVRWEGNKNSVTADLGEVSIKALSFDELCVSVARGMSFDKAMEWANTLPAIGSGSSRRQGKKGTR